MSRKVQIALLVAVVLLGVFASIVYAAGGETNPLVLKDLAKVRQATAKYHDVTAAYADGFIRTPECVASPDGGMGIHFINQTFMKTSCILANWSFIPAAVGYRCLRRDATSE